jgi:limonene-1,2-epoxide hydrolase
MQRSNRNLSHRTFLALGVMAALAAGFSGTALAAKKSANSQVVADFIANWNDPDKAVTYLADDASVRMVEDKPPVVGPAAVAAAFKGFMSNGVKISVKVNSTVTKGPVVVDSRVDTLTTPGKPDQPFNVVGVFVVKDGKIKEWTDYSVK